ncbi:hypothetical protein ANCCAN_03217 [Ancylostoma caninum]|uniref:SXP/RAL-2 family protein Ani s 5-like cation-binding domain-containing protein n=1 Tax=Ancylostoma caninum TaxID=29170 RepID=A0A368H1Y0_ANCCA|nr:hypothetical protein ANCCAN_03217 [Ancylostoma caninum]
MVKVLVLIIAIVPSLICADQTDMQSKIKNITIDSLPGVSVEDIAKLRQMLTPPPSTIEEVKKIAEQWIASLPPSEKEAIKQHIGEMRQKLSLEGADIKTD